MFLYNGNVTKVCRRQRKWGKGGWKKKAFICQYTLCPHIHLHLILIQIHLRSKYTLNSIEWVTFQRSKSILFIYPIKIQLFSLFNFQVNVEVYYYLLLNATHTLRVANIKLVCDSNSYRKYIHETKHSAQTKVCL